MATSDHVPEPSSIASQSVLGAKLLSQALESAFTNLSSVVPPKEPIIVETTDVSNRLQVTEEEHLSISPPDATKTLPEKTFAQEQRSDNSSVDDHPAYADAQTTNSPAQPTVDGKKFSYLIEALTPLSIIEDQAPRVKRAKRNLADREALLAKKNSNKQEAKELAQLIDDLRNSPFKIEPELNQLRAKRAKLKKELENVKAVIDHHESNLAQIPDVIKQKK
ncbi:uncharacterized protein [Miscanthus floridulus]|uniref:uncharacterized protein n=1 Tax=Miscanthus floridulus TaxID=154761 RepID=UPI00345AFBBF